MVSDADSFMMTAESLKAMKRSFERSRALHQRVPWRAHFYEPDRQIAWYCHDYLPETDHWAERLRLAKEHIKRLSVGIAGPIDIIKDESVLLKADALDATVMPFDVGARSQRMRLARCTYPSVADFVYECQLKLSPHGARAILDRLLAKCSSETNKQRKGVHLEVLVAVLLSQVEGFEVIQRGISNRTQQIDVAVHNRNTAGVLRKGDLVLAEAKNWTMPPGVPEYASFLNKLMTRRGRVELGFFVTTDRIPKTVTDEELRNSRTPILVVTLDKWTLPAIWRSEERSITQMIEAAVMQAALK